MLISALKIFQIKPDYNLKIMEPNQTLFSITSKIINKLEAVLEDFGPDLVMVHGDTTTTLSASIASFIKKLSWHILKQDLGHPISIVHSLKK